MFELLNELGDWLLDFAGSGWGILVLGANSFFEAIFFPVPPDPLLIGMSIVQPHLALWFAALVTVTSVAGALLGYWLGQRFGRPLLYRVVPRSRIELVERIFKRYGMWAILLAAVTPIPYKVFAISAGVLDLDRRTFILASLVGRGVRFFTLAALVMVYGKSIEAFIASNFGVLTLVSAAAVLGIVAAWAVLHRRRRARDARL